MKIDNINRDTTCAVLVTASWEPRADDSSEALVFDNPRVPEDVLYSHSEYRANASAATVSLMVSRAPEDVREGVCPPEVKEELNTVRCAKARFVAVRA